MNSVTTTDDMLFAMQQRNLIYNHNFLYYSNKTENGATTFHHPDGWLYQDKGDKGDIGYNVETQSCVIQKSDGQDKMTFTQMISEFPRWQESLHSQKVSVCALVTNPDASALDFDLTLKISDGISENSKTAFLKPGNSEEVRVDLTVSNRSEQVKVVIECATPNALIYLKKVYANVGEVALDTLPCMVQGIIGERKQYPITQNAPAEELPLCNELSELSENYTRLRSVINGQFGINEETGNPYLLNMSGYFSRAWDNGAKVDPDAKNRVSIMDPEKVVGDIVGSMEEDVFEAHDHGLTFSPDKTILTGKEGAAVVINTTSQSRTEVEKDGKETRPVNISELYTIKWA